MKSGEIEVSFKTGATQLTRGLIVTRGTDVVAFNAAKNGPDKLSANIRLELPTGVAVQNVTLKYEAGYIFFGARVTGGQDFGLVARVCLASGSGEMLSDGISIKQSDGFSIFAKTFVGGNRDAEFKNLKNELADIKVNYSKLLASSESAHKKLFDAARLELEGADGRSESDMQTLLSSTGSGVPEPGLIEHLYNYGKFLAICGGAAGSPAGLWCGNALTARGYLEFNIGAHQLYGGITKSVAAENIAELITLFEKYADDLKKNAARVYGARGFFVPRFSSPQSLLPGSTDPGVVNFIASAAIAANIVYSYFQVTGDIKMLRGRIMPILREVFNFYSDFLKLDNYGFYSTIPSYSPDSVPGNIIMGKPLTDFRFATNSTIDFLALENLLDNLIQGAQILNLTDEIPAWEDMKTKIPPYSVGDTGAIKEYVNSAFIDGGLAVGCLHGFGLYPLKNFSFSEKTVQYRGAVSGAAPVPILLKKASVNSGLARLTKAARLQTGEVLAMYAAQLAHAGEAAAVRNILMRLVAACNTSSGLCLASDFRGSGFTRQGAAMLDISGNIGF